MPMALPRVFSQGEAFEIVDLLSTDNVGDCVYIRANEVGGRLQMERADPSDPSKMPAPAVIVQKTTATLGKVQFSGPMRGIYTGLAPGPGNVRTLFVGLDGRLTLTAPISPNIAQKMGEIGGSDLVLLDPVVLPDQIATVVGDVLETDPFVATPGQTIFNLSTTPADTQDVSFLVEGVAYEIGTHYTVVGTVLTWLNIEFSFAGGERVEIRYQKAS